MYEHEKEWLDYIMSMSVQKKKLIIITSPKGQNVFLERWINSDFNSDIPEVLLNPDTLNKV